MTPHGGATTKPSPTSVNPAPSPTGRGHQNDDHPLRTGEAEGSPLPGQEHRSARRLPSGHSGMQEGQRQARLRTGHQAKAQGDRVAAGSDSEKPYAEVGFRSRKHPKQGKACYIPTWARRALQPISPRSRTMPIGHGVAPSWETWELRLRTAWPSNCPTEQPAPRLPADPAQRPVN